MITELYILFFDPIKFLINYNKQQCILEFEKCYYKCNICFEEYKGINCIKLKHCNHIYCKK